MRRTVNVSPLFYLHGTETQGIYYVELICGRGTAYDRDNNPC